MAYLVFARKYRPQTFEAVTGQSHVTQTLSNAVTSGRLAHAILLSGPRGTGKTTIARILAKCINCGGGPTATPCNQCRSCTEITAGNAMDVLEIDGASNNKVENVRELRENAKYMPAYSPYKVYIIDEVHMLSDAAFNALLKILEEPPAHVMFIFATTEAHKIPITILSRCQRHDLRRIGIDAITRHMDQIRNGEGFDISEKGLALIAREADGSIRDALSLLDQIVTCSDKTITDAQVVDILGIIDRQILFDISEALFSGNMGRILDICSLLYRQGRHLMKFYTELIEHFRNLMVVKMAGPDKTLSDTAAHERELMAAQVEDVTQPYLFQVLDILFEEEWRVKQSASPKLALEMTFFRIMQVKPAFSLDELITRLDRLRTGEYPALPPGGTEGGHPPAGLPQQQAPGDPATGPPAARPARDGIDTPPPGTAAPQESPAEPAATPESRLPDTATNTATDIAPDASPDISPGTTPEKWPPDIEAMSPGEVQEAIKNYICGESPSLGACLAGSTLQYTPPDAISIEVDASSPSASLLGRKKQIAGIEKYCNAFFKKPVKVTLELKKNGPDRAEQKEIQEQQKHEAMSHPIVNAALRIFNGKIVEVKIL